MIKTVFLIGTALMSLQLVQPFGTGLPISYLLFLVSIFLVALDGIASKKPLHEWMPIHPLWIPAFLILFGGLLSTINSLDIKADVFDTLKTWFALVLWVSLIVVMVRRNMEHAIINAFIFTVLLTSMIAIWDSTFKTEVGKLIVTPDADIDMNAPEFIFYGSAERYRGTTYHVNGQAYFTLIAVCLTLNSIFTNLKDEQVSKKKLLFLVITCSVLLYANILTGSVSGYTGLIVSAIVLALIHIAHVSKRNYSKIMLRYLLFLWVVSFILILLYSDILHYFNTNVTRVSSDTGIFRYQAIQNAWSFIVQSPIFGTSSRSAFGVHNPLIQIFASSGLFAFLGLLSVYLIVIKYIFQAVGSYLNIKQIHPHLPGICAAIIGCFVVDMGQNNVFGLEKWLLVGLLFGLELKTKNSFRWKGNHFTRLQILQTRLHHHSYFYPRTSIQMFRRKRFQTMKDLRQ